MNSFLINGTGVEPKAALDLRIAGSVWELLAVISKN
jgi:hypothetical protein